MRPSNLLAAPRRSSLSSANRLRPSTAFGDSHKLLGGPKERDLTRQSIFNDATVIPATPEIPFWRRFGFTVGVISVKIVLPAIMALTYSGVFYLYSDLIYKQSDPVWLALYIPLTYLTGTIIVSVLLVLLSSVGFLNFRSGLMDYFSIGFFHWYICTDILFGWMQMIMGPLSGTGLYINMFRWMGADIGDGAYIDIPGGLRELNNIVLGDDGVLLTRFIYAHYIDNGKLQFAPVIIENEATINKETMVMPLTTYEMGSTMRPYSSTIKGQLFGAHRVFQGHPAAKAFDSLPSTAAGINGGTAMTPLHQ